MLVQSHSWANSCGQAPLQAPLHHLPRPWLGHVPRASLTGGEVTARNSPVPTPPSEAVLASCGTSGRSSHLPGPPFPHVRQIPPILDVPCEDHMTESRDYVKSNHYFNKH